MITSHLFCDSVARAFPCARHLFATIGPQAEHFWPYNNPPAKTQQNQLARRGILRDAFCQTIKRKNLENVGNCCALSSVEEHFLHTEGVAGSSPAARTILSIERRKGG
jgi:hypothetical protein